MSEAVTAAAYHRRDISGRVWEIVALHVSGSSGKVGRTAQDDRRVLILRTGAPWRDLSPNYGH